MIGHFWDQEELRKKCLKLSVWNAKYSKLTLVIRVELPYKSTDKDINFLHLYCTSTIYKNSNVQVS
jgi:hypothetical protein